MTLRVTNEAHVLLLAPPFVNIKGNRVLTEIEAGSFASEVHDGIVRIHVVVFLANPNASLKQRQYVFRSTWYERARKFSDVAYVIESRLCELVAECSHP